MTEPEAGLAIPSAEGADSSSSNRTTSSPIVVITEERSHTSNSFLVNDSGTQCLQDKYDRLVEDYSKLNCQYNVLKDKYKSALDKI